MAAEQCRLQRLIWAYCCIRILDLKRTETLCSTGLMSKKVIVWIRKNAGFI